MFVHIDWLNNAKFKKSKRFRKFRTIIVFGKYLSPNVNGSVILIVK
jgi:hypothetical protein